MDPETEQELKDIFDTYDIDGSGKLDFKEMGYMMETLGIVASTQFILKMIRDVDTDGNDEIDFDELKSIVLSNSGKLTKGASAVSFASIFDKKKNGGPPMGWRTDKLGSCLSVSATSVSGTAGKGKWGVALAAFTGSRGDPNKAAWLSTASYTEATALLEIQELGGDGYVGIVGINFNARKVEDGEWDIGLGASVDQPGMAPWAGVRLSTGEVFLKGKKLSSVLGNMEKGNRIQFEIDMHAQSMVIRGLKMVVDKKTGKPRDDPPHWDDSMKVDISSLPPELAIAVSLGEHADGASSSIRFVGSSCERTPKPTATQDGSDSAKSATTAGDPMLAAAQAMAL